MIFRIFIWPVILCFSCPVLGQNQENKDRPETSNRASTILKAMNSDTIRYTKEYIITRKDFYTGKPLDSLLKDLPFALKRYINAINPRNRYISESTTLYPTSYEEKALEITQKKNPLTIVVTWDTPLNKRELSDSGLPTAGGEWTKAAYDYFKNKIIGNIDLVKYDF